MVDLAAVTVAAELHALVLPLGPVHDGVGILPELLASLVGASLDGDETLVVGRTPDFLRLKVRTLFMSGGVGK